MQLKTCEDIETATAQFIGVLQQAAQAATPKRHPLHPASNLPLDIKSLVAIKRRARSRWRKTHALGDRRLFNSASNKLKAALHELRNASFTAYVSSLTRVDNSIWKPLKSRNKPRTPLPPIHKNSTPPGPWAKSDSEKVDLFASHLAEVFTSHDNTLDPDDERELALNTHPTENLRAFTLSELTQVTKPAKSIQGAWIRPHHCPHDTGNAARRLSSSPVHF
jgi:hypothetical protein